MCCPFSLCKICQTYVLKGRDLDVTPSAPSCPPTLLDEMEDRRQRVKEKQVSPIYPWDPMRRAARKNEEQPHKLLPLHEAPTRRNNQSIRVNKPFLNQEIRRIKKDLGDSLDDPEKYIRAFSAL